MLILTDQNFGKEVLKSKIPVLVDFYADWCGPCQMYGPIFEEIAEEYGGKIKVGKMNVDENQATPAKYNVMSIPTTLFVKKGELVGQLVGPQTKEVLSEKITRLGIASSAELKKKFEMK